MTPTAYMYTCRNLGQVALKWLGQPAPTGPGWTEVKQTGLYSADQVEALVRAAYLKGFNLTMDGYNGERPGLSELKGYQPFIERMSNDISELLK